MTATQIPHVVEGETLNKITTRLIPFLFMLYIFAYLDRVNVGVAKLEMNHLPWFSDKVFGLGAGIFFLGYFLFEVPSNLILERAGARRWIARIMITWGIISTCMLFVNGVTSFYVMRFLLGIAEAGFFPGIILYLTYWFTAQERARVIALFMTATVVANIIGNPLSSTLLKINAAGLAGWQWLFLLEGIPSILLGLVVLAYLPDGPKQARWLSEAEREWVVHRVEAERAQRAHQHHATLRAAFSHPMVWLLCLLYLCIVIASYGIELWLPQMLKSLFKITDQQAGYMAAIPFIAGAIGMVIMGSHSDRTGERRKHIACSALIGSLGVAMAASLHGGLPILCGFSLAIFGVKGTLGPFWSLPPAFLKGTAAAGGIALINSVGNLGGFFGPTIMGWLKKPDVSDYSSGLYALAGFLLLGSVVALLAHPEKPRNA